MNANPQHGIHRVRSGHSRRRVAVISEHASPLGTIGGVDGGGQNVYVAQVAKRLAAAGHRVDVFTRRDREDLPRVVEHEGYRVVHVDAGPPSFVRKEDLLPHMPAFTEFVCQYVAEQPWPYDVVHANFWMSGMTARELKRRFDIPFIITFHALGKVRRIYQGDADGFADDRLAIEESLVAEADRVIAECPQDEIDLLAMYGADPRRITMIPCGYDPTECSPVDRAEARERLGLPADRPILLQLGRLVPRKGIDNVVRALACIRERVPDALLVVAGGESDEPDPEATPEIGRLLGIAQASGVADAVRFVGRRPRAELKDWYSAADIFVTTPWYEPFGITPVEAMACGTPVIGANVGGIQYTVADGDTGLLVPPHDPDALALAATRIFTDPGLQQRLAIGGIRRARDLFTWDRVAALIDELVEAVISERADEVAREEVRRRTVQDGFDGLVRVLSAARARNTREATRMARMISNCFANGNKVLVCGNGGSAADAQHFAGELVARFRAESRRALPVIVLGAEFSSLTAWANDVSWESVFERQVEAFGQPGDVLIGFSTSGRSTNVVRAFHAAKCRGVQTLAMVGGDGGDLLHLATASLVVPTRDTQRIQEVHGLLVHLLCELIEQDLATLEPIEVEAAS
ncbi:MAG: glycosyltransferase [Dehalococcoidia bacterium]|nr:glycosyltransferase [Dehalococcoidia bacterium]